MKLTSPLISFMIASLGIHIALVATSEPTNITLPGSKESVMAVKLEEKKQPLIKATKNSNIKQKTYFKKNTVTKEKIPEKSETKVATNESKPQLNQNKTETRARVSSLIYKELKQFFTYPKLAVKRNWQGKVLLSLRVSSSGNIENIQVKQSSGYNILDQAAIKSLRKVGKLPQVSAWLSNDIELKFPVIYKLIEG